MAGPIKIAVLADTQQAARSMSRLGTHTESTVAQMGRAMSGDMSRGMERVQAGFDTVDTRAMGFRDTVTGVQDSVRGFNALTTSTADATAKVKTAQTAYNAAVKQYGKDSVQAVTANTALGVAQEELAAQQAPLADKLFLLGTGVGDLASGFVNLLIPTLAMAGPAITGVKTAMTALNLTFLTNPVFLVIAAVIALVAIFVIAYKKSETFRKIVDGAFRGVKAAASAAWNWIKGNWPKIAAVITGPIGLATRFVIRNWSKIVSKVKSVPAAIRGAFSDAGSWLVSAGRNVVTGLWNGIQGMAGWIRGQARNLAASIVNEIKGQLRIGSPSKVAKQIGEYFGQGLGMGLDSSRQGVARAATGLAAATVPATMPMAASATSGLTVTLEPSGDPLIDALMKQLRVKIRANGGNVQRVLGMA